jgi:hypothetical protein
MSYVDFWKTPKAKMYNAVITLEAQVRFPDMSLGNANLNAWEISKELRKHLDCINVNYDIDVDVKDVDVKEENEDA